MNDFWLWFLANEDRLFAFEIDQEPTFDELAARLRAIHEDLTFEFGPVVADRRELVISAGGHKSAFPAVEQLCKAAPELARWILIPFRPRRPRVSIVEMSGKSLDPRNVDVVLLHNGRQAGLHVFVPGYVHGDATLGQMVYLMLDEALGEFCVETQVALIKLLPYEQKTEGERVLMCDLAERFDDLMGRLPASGRTRG